MSRSSRPHDGNATFIIMILVGAATWQHWQQLVRITHIALTIALVVLLLNFSVKSLLRRKIGPHSVDTMSGLEFERYVAGLLRQNGFHNISLTERYDFGVDIIAEKDGVCWGVQVKRHSGLVKANAVRQVVTGLRVYGCDRAMVITNSIFSTVARRLAQANDCVLIDQKGLRQLERYECIL